MSIIREADLASYLGTPELANDPRLGQIVSLTNGLIDEEWEAPVTPTPTSVKLLALTVAARAWGITPGRGPLESITRSADDASRTERYAVPQSNADGHTVYLTKAELGRLNRRTTSRRPRTIRTSVGY